VLVEGKKEEGKKRREKNVSTPFFISYGTGFESIRRLTMIAPVDQLSAIDNSNAIVSSAEDEQAAI
jgi:hypothetical protein